MTNTVIMERYLDRLGHTRPPAPSWQTLGDLVTRHLQIVPFENLDIVDGRMLPDLATATVLYKVAIRERGGFCYELNEAFGALLMHLGFRVRRIEARVWMPPQEKFGAPFDHLALIVTLPEGEFLTDVGFGDNNRLPLRLPEDATTDISGRYTLAQTSDDLWLLSRSDRPLYEMTLVEQPLSAFLPMYRHHRTSPDSLFGKGLICTRATRSGRVTVSRDHLIVVDEENRTETVISDRDEILKQHFDIVKET